MPWRPVSARADGFLSLLGVKSQGRNPDVLNESVQPVSEMEGWYLRSSAVPFINNANLAFAQESFVAVTAGEQEWVYIHYATGLITGNAAADPVTFFDLQLPPVALFQTPLQPAVPISGQKWSFSTLRDLWMPPRSVLYIVAFGTVADSVGSSGLITRVQV